MFLPAFGSAGELRKSSAINPGFSTSVGWVTWENDCKVLAQRIRSRELQMTERDTQEQAYVQACVR